MLPFFASRALIACLKRSRAVKGYRVRFVPEADSYTTFYLDQFSTGDGMDKITCRQLVLF